MSTVWIVRGDVHPDETLPGGVWPEAKPRQTEWQFSDGPPGERGYSEDFLDLAEGLAGLAPGTKVNTDFADFTPEELTLFLQHMGAIVKGP